MPNSNGGNTKQPNAMPMSNYRRHGIDFYMTDYKMTEQAEKIAATLQKLKAAPKPTTQADCAAIRAQLARMAVIIETLEPIQALANIRTKSE